ncbi:MAG: hypothetical protein GWO24_36275 [Akkermansiaceae bacterium]|nr:hypothetical protein [Akkermansiaceae bacterium]
MKVAQAAWLLGAVAVEREYVPDHPEVLHATPLVSPGESGRVTFTAPAVKADYPFVCTLPGHALTMKGILHVGEPGDSPPPVEARREEIPPTGRERARKKMQRYRRLMDGGPTLAGVISPGKATMVNGEKVPLGTTNRGVAARLGERGEAAILFDKELVRVTAGWTGGFIHFLDGREDERAEYRHQIGGNVHHLLGQGTGWASANGEWDDPRERRLGQLPPSRVRYLGHHRAGERVIFRYRVNGVEVLDSPWFRDGAVFTRDIRVAPSERPLRLRLAVAEGIHAALAQHPQLSLRVADGFHEVAIAPRPAPLLFQAALSRKPCVAGSPPDLDRLAETGNAGNSGPPIFTLGTVGKTNGPFAIDTLALPYENPWNSILYTSGLDFFANGDAAICTSHGEVWTVSGIDGSLRNLTWRRIASGLANPLGLRIVGDTVHVVSLHEITRLHDFDGDGTADFYESFHAGVEVSETHHRFTNDLHTDSKGNFYYLKCTDEGRSAHSGSLIRVSPDGSQFELFATGLRNPNGMSIGPGDIITFGKQQGGWIPSSGIHVVGRGRFYGYLPSHHRKTPPTEFEKPLCWIPHGVDNSCGGQVWVPDDGRWGPLQGKLLHLSYGKCQLFLVLHERVGDVYQGGVIRIPGLEFESGAMRARFRPQDGQLYVTGLRGWQTTAAMPGCLQRVRYTGNPVRLPAALKVEKNGVRLSFFEALDPAAALDPGLFKISQWQYRWTRNYGSPDFKISSPDEKGRDHVPVQSVEPGPDGKSVLIRIEDIKPVMQMAIHYDLRAASGASLKGEIFATINVVPDR